MTKTLAEAGFHEGRNLLRRRVVLKAPRVASRRQHWTMIVAELNQAWGFSPSR